MTITGTHINPHPAMNPYTAQPRRWEGMITLSTEFTPEQYKANADALDFLESHRAGKRILNRIANHYSEENPLPIKPLRAQNHTTATNHFNPIERSIYLRETDKHSTHYRDDGTTVTMNDRSLIAHELRHAGDKTLLKRRNQAVSMHQQCGIEQRYEKYQACSGNHADGSPEALAMQSARAAFDEAKAQFEPYLKRMSIASAKSETKAMEAEAAFLPDGKTRSAYLLTASGKHPQSDMITVGDWHRIYDYAVRHQHDDDGKAIFAKDALKSLKRMAKHFNIDAENDPNLSDLFTYDKHRRPIAPKAMTIPDSSMSMESLIAKYTGLLPELQQSLQQRQPEAVAEPAMLPTTPPPPLPAQKSRQY